MARSTTTTSRSLGRPPAADSTETRARILEGARRCFARDGYAKTTNKDIATEADLTTGAIYHYFDSKPALFAAVVEEVTDIVFSAFEDVAERETSFTDRMRGVIEVAGKMHTDDLSLAAFSATFLIELQRHPDVVDALDPGTLSRGQAFFARLADDAIARGELADDVDADAVANMLTAVTLGLAYFGALNDTPVHEATLAMAARLFDNTLFPPGRRRRRV